MRLLSLILQVDWKAYEERQAYQAAVSFTDANVGALMDELKTLGVWDSTVIALVGDHGFKLGEHGAWCKVSVWGGWLLGLVWPFTHAIRHHPSHYISVISRPESAHELRSRHDYPFLPAHSGCD